MNPLAIPCHFHDGLIESCSVGPRREFRLTISLSPVFNITAEKVQVRFGKIQEYEKLVQAVVSLVAPHSTPFVATIERLDYEPSYQSTAHNYCFLLETDQAPPIIIHCGSVQVEPIADDEQ